MLFPTDIPNITKYSGMNNTNSIFWALYEYRKPDLITNGATTNNIIDITSQKTVFFIILSLL